MNILTIGEKRKFDSINSSNLPLGQKLLVVGFKPITIDQLYERFACLAIETSANDRLKAKELKDFFERNNIPEKKQKKYYIEKNRYVNEWQIWKKSFGGDDWKSSFGPYSCTVKRVALDEYIDDVIPERVIKNIEIARHLGVIGFQIAFPILEKVIQKDPIALGVVGEKFVELGAWE